MPTTSAPCEGQSLVANYQNLVGSVEDHRQFVIASPLGYGCRPIRRVRRKRCGYAQLLIALDLARVVAGEQRIRVCRADSPPCAFSNSEAYRRAPKLGASIRNTSKPVNLCVPCDIRSTPPNLRLFDGPSLPCIRLVYVSARPSADGSKPPPLFVVFPEKLGLTVGPPCCQHGQDCRQQCNPGPYPGIPANARADAGFGYRLKTPPLRILQPQR